MSLEQRNVRIPGFSAIRLDNRNIVKSLESKN
jgi:hypothetical protein